MYEDPNFKFEVNNIGDEECDDEEYGDEDYDYDENINIIN